MATSAGLLIAGLLSPAVVSASTDSDHDGLPNTWERTYSLTSPFRADTDRDGLPDGREDPDHDGLTNRQEYVARMNPRRADTDRDGIRDGREDTDGDGLRTAFEFRAGTSPRHADTDRDGLRDGRENPDRDGLSNAMEQRLGTKPRVADTDGDGWTDGAEWRAGTNPLRASSHPTAAATPAPTATPPGVRSVTVTSIAALKSFLADNTVDEIVVANGTYAIAKAPSMSSSSLWIGATFASRTRPITVRAATIGGVTFDGGGGFGSLEFAEGAHDQTWIGFKFANMVASQNGVITFGGYDPSGRPPPHHITLRNITLMSSCRSNSGSINEQGIYFAHAAGVGPHDLLLEDIAVDGSGTNPLWSAIHAYHGDSANPGSYNVTIRRLHVTGTTNAIVLWVDGLHDWLIEGGTITNAADHAISFNSSPASNIVFKDLVSTGSGSSGFSSLVGATPRGVTFVNDSLR